VEKGSIQFRRKESEKRYHLTERDNVRTDEAGVVKGLKKKNQMLFKKGTKEVASRSSRIWRGTKYICEAANERAIATKGKPIIRSKTKGG